MVNRRLLLEQIVALVAHRVVLVEVLIRLSKQLERYLNKF